MRVDTLEMPTLALRGELIGKDDPGYMQACKLYNGMIDKRPAMIARCWTWRT